MKRLESCCKKYVDISQPTRHGLGNFEEVHKCPECKSEIKIEFKAIEVLGEENDYIAVSANYVIR